MEADDAVAENRRLRAEVERLQRGATRSGSTRGVPWRGATVLVLLLLVALLAPASVVARWTRAEVSDSGRYADTVAPLASDPAVQRAISDRVTREVVEAIDVRAVTDEAVAALRERGLPPRVAASLSALGTPLASGVRSFVRERVVRLVGSEEFERAWVEANRAAHEQVVAVLTGRTGAAVDVTGGRISVDLAAVVNAVKARLAGAGFALAERIPVREARFTILESADVGRAQSTFRLLQGLAAVLPVAVLLLLLAAVVVGRPRRRSLVAGACAVALSMVVLALLLGLARLVYLAHVPPDVLPRDAAAAVFDALVRSLRGSLRVVLLVSAAVAAALWVSGPGAEARGLRRSVHRLWVRVSARPAGGPGRAARWVAAHRGGLRVGVPGVALLVLVLVPHPGPGLVVSLVVVVALVLTVSETTGRPARVREP